MAGLKNKSVKTVMTEDAYNQLLKYCENNDETISQVIRKALKEYLEKQTNN